MGSMVKSTVALAKNPEFISQCPHEGKQPEENLMPSFGLYGHCTYMVHRHMCRQDTHTYKIVKVSKQ